jgi:hypothetical protein
MVMDEQQPSNLLSGQQVPDVDDDDFEQANETGQTRLEYLNAVNPRPKRPLWLKLLAGLVILALLGGGGWLAYQKFVRKPAADTTKPPVASESKTAATEDVPIVTDHHDSSYFNLGFDYPEDWQVVDKGGGLLTVTSPAITLGDATGQDTKALVVLSIMPKGQNVAEFTGSSALAVRNSEKITYKNPTDVQRAQTYLSFLQYSASATKALDAIFITGDFGYKTDQYVPKTDIAKLDPLIHVNFMACTDDSCAKTDKPLALDPGQWANSKLQKPVLTILTSLAVH